MTETMLDQRTKAAVRTYFDQDAAGYRNAYTAGASGTRSEIFRARRQLVLASLVDPVGRVLDIGSGPGAFTEALLARGAEVWNVDLSTEMIRQAQDHLATHPEVRRVHFQVADVEKLPFGPGTFDTVLCIGVLQYLAGPDHALRELGRIVRVGGQVIVSFPNRSSPLNLMLQVATRTVRSGHNLLRRVGLPVQTPVSRLTLRDDIPNQTFARRYIEVLAQVAGLEVEALLNHSFHFPFPIPGLRAPIKLWDRIADHVVPSSWVKRWGRETIIRFRRSS